MITVAKIHQYDLKVGDRETDWISGVGADLGQSGYFVLLHVNPVIDQTGLLQLLDLGAEPSQNVFSLSW